MNVQLSNRVQLLGVVCKHPKDFSLYGKKLVRLVIEVDERSADGELFSSYHPVVISKEQASVDGDVKCGDLVLIEGRLNNYIIEKEGETKTRGVNVQAFGMLILRRLGTSASDIKDSQKEFIPDKHNRENSMNVVPLFGRVDFEDEPPF